MVKQMATRSQSENENIKRVILKFGNEVKQLRLFNKLSYLALAKLSKTRVKLIKQLERGTIDPDQMTIEFITHLTQALGVDYDVAFSKK